MVKEVCIIVLKTSVNVLIFLTSSDNFFSTVLLCSYSVDDKRRHHIVEFHAIQFHSFNIISKNFQNECHRETVKAS